MRNALIGALLGDGVGAGAGYLGKDKIREALRSGILPDDPELLERELKSVPKMEVDPSRYNRTSEGKAKRKTMIRGMKKKTLKNVDKNQKPTPPNAGDSLNYKQYAPTEATESGEPVDFEEIPGIEPDIGDLKYPSEMPLKDLIYRMAALNVAHDHRVISDQHYHEAIAPFNRIFIEKIHSIKDSRQQSKFLNQVADLQQQYKNENPY